LSTLHNLFGKGVNDGLIAANAVDLANDLVLASSFVRSLEISEVKSLATNTTVLDWRTSIYGGFYTGCQLIEIAYRLWTDLKHDDLGRPILCFPPNSRNFEKRVLVHPAYMEHLESVPRVNEFICPTLAELQRWTIDGLFADIVKAAQLGGGVTFRCLRHTFAAQLGVTIKRLADLPPETVLNLPDIRVPPLPCQLAK
jgi:integrase